MQLPAVWAAVKLISETIALLPWRPFRESGPARILQANSRLDILLHRRPNQEMTPFQFREFLIASTLLHGNGYAEIERSRSGEPVALHPLHPKRVDPQRDTRSNLVYMVRSETGEEVAIPMRQMFHVQGPTRDGIVGRSVIAHARDSIGVGIAADQYAGSFFGNGAIPGLVIKQGNESPDLSKEGADNLLASFEQRHRGSRRFGKPAYLERGFSIEQLGIPQKDAQFIETRKFTVTEIARWFRVPPHKIADMEKATFSNIESQERNFANDAIIPWTTRLEQEANTKLTNANNIVTKLNVNSLLRGDSQARAEFYTKMRDLGALSINEIRALEDLNPIDGGDLRLVPLNMVSLDRAARSGGTDPAGAVRGVLLEAHERMATKESNAVSRAVKSGRDLQKWAVEFYQRHGLQLVSALLPGAMAAGQLADLDSDLIGSLVECHAGAYCAASAKNVIAGCWQGPPSAATQTDQLLGRLMGARDVQ